MSVGTEQKICQCLSCWSIALYTDYDVRPNGKGNGFITHATCYKCGGDAWGLVHAGWNKQDVDGYDLWAYFDTDGKYRGPDSDGIEPHFEHE